MLRTLCFAALIIACESKKSEPSKSAETSKPADPAADKPAETKPAEPPPAPASDPRCEALRDKFLAWQTERFKGALGGVDDKLRGEMEAEAKKELVIAKDKFVGACIAMGAALDESCFVKDTFRQPRAERDRCRKIVGELEKHIYAK